MVRNLDHVENEKNKSLFLITATVCFILTILAIFSFTFNYFMSRGNSTYENSIIRYINDINSTNSSVILLIKGQTIDLAAAKKLLPDKIDHLSRDKDALKQLQPIESYKIIHQDLISGLENNINMYKQINAILISPKSPDLETSATNIATYKNDCMNFYSLTVFKSTKILLSEKSLTFINNSISYVNELVRLKKTTEIKASQNSDFNQNVDNILNKFQPLMIDFNVYAVKARNGIGTLDEVITKVDDTKNSFNGVTDDFSKLTVPPEAISLYNALNSTFTVFDLYLNDFRDALINEKRKAYSVALDKESVDSLYSLPLNNFKDLYTDYDRFVKLYDNFKSSK